MTLLCSGASLPYSPASPSRGFPVFSGTTLALRLPHRLHACLVCSQQALPSIDCSILLVRHDSHVADAWTLFTGIVPSPATSRWARRGSPVFASGPLVNTLGSWTPAEPSHQAFPMLGCCPASAEGRTSASCPFRSSITSLFTRCVRFVPTFPQTTQHSLLGDGQSFPIRHFSRQGLSNSFCYISAPP